MKLSKGIFVGGLLLAGLLLSSRAEAQTGAGHPGSFHPSRMFEILQLTDAQRTTIDKLFAASGESLRPLHERVREQRQLLSDAMQKQPFDEALVRFQAKELASLQAELMVQRAVMMNQIASVLTPAQRAALQQLREQRKARFDEWRERRRHHLGQQQG
jgi:Spy/CpxP family protein refolding chaperone